MKPLSRMSKGDIKALEDYNEKEQIRYEEELEAEIASLNDEIFLLKKQIDILTREVIRLEKEGRVSIY